MPSYKSNKLVFATSSIIAWLVIQSYVASPSIAQISDLAAKLPSTANSLVVIHAESLFRSPLGEQQGWRESYADAFELTPWLLPPTAEQFVMAAELDLESMTPAWQATAMQLSTRPTAQEIAARLTGIVDELNGLPAVWTRSRTCIVQFAPQIYGSLTPATRPQAMRWVTGSGQLSPYLSAAMQYAEQADTQIIMAIDLQHVVRPERLRQRLAAGELVSADDLEPTVQRLSSIRGVTLGVRVRDKALGKLKVEFANDVSSLAPIAKPLILGVLRDAGAMLDEFAD